MGLLTQQMMGQLFTVTDGLQLNREAITVQLITAGKGTVMRTAAGKFDITLPETDDLGPFLADLPYRLRALVEGE